MQESMKLLDVEMKRSDELLSQMIPKSVSDKIKAGANAVDTCEVFDMVTMVFNDIPAFLDICSKCDGLKVSCVSIYRSSQIQNLTFSDANPMLFPRSSAC